MAVYRFRKEELEGHLNRNALWAIVYGDLMSYLMIFFLLMFSFALSKESKKVTKVEEALTAIQRVFGAPVDPKDAARAQQRDLEKLTIAGLEEAARLGALGKDVKVIATEQRIQVNLGEGVLFDSGKAELKSEASSSHVPPFLQLSFVAVVKQTPRSSAATSRTFALAIVVVPLSSMRTRAWSPIA
jgi:flagellar motor protein MotB